MKKVLRSGMGITDFLITAAQKTQIHVAEDTKLLVTELKRIGNNLNQITAKINTGVFHSYNFREVIDLQRAIKEGVVLGNSRIFGYIKDNGKRISRTNIGWLKKYREKEISSNLSVKLHT